MILELSERFGGSGSDATGSVVQRADQRTNGRGIREDPELA
jgi:hypothetical protein